MASDNEERLVKILVAVHGMSGSDGTLDGKGERRRQWKNLSNLVEESLALEKKQQLCIDNIAMQGQVLASYAHALLRAGQTGNQLATRQAYQDLARYCKILREE